MARQRRQSLSRFWLSGMEKGKNPELFADLVKLDLAGVTEDGGVLNLLFERK